MFSCVVCFFIQIVIVHKKKSKKKNREGDCLEELKQRNPCFIFVCTAWEPFYFFLVYSINNIKIAVNGSCVVLIFFLSKFLLLCTKKKSKKKKEFAVEQKLLLTRSWLDLVVRASRFSVMYKRMEEQRFSQDLNNRRHFSAIIIQKAYR